MKKILNIDVKNEIGPFDYSPDLERNFREVWTNNADALSQIYTKSNALKTDFTRLGKRTLKGFLEDGYNSVKRYVQNNFLDYER